MWHYLFSPVLNNVCIFCHSLEANAKLSCHSVQVESGVWAHTQFPPELPSSYFRNPTFSIFVLTLTSCLLELILPPQLSALVHLLGFAFFPFVFVCFNQPNFEVFNLFQQFLKMWNILLLEVFLVLVHCNWLTKIHFHYFFCFIILSGEDINSDVDTDLIISS